jgi:HK97 family phage major capsid protein
MATEFELQSNLDRLRADFRSKYESYPTKKLADGSEARDIPAADIEGVRKMNADINTAAQELEDVRGFRKTYDYKPEADEAPANMPNLRGNRGGEQRETRSIGRQVIETENFASELRSVGGISVTLPEFRATMTTTGGYVPEVLREGPDVLAISQFTGLVDYLSVVPTDQNSTQYMEQTTRTNTAAPKSEGAAANEATIAYTERNSPVQDIPVFIPATLNQLDDVHGLRAAIEEDLMLMIRQELDYQVTVGNGTAPNLTGVTNHASKYTYAKAAGDAYFDAILKAITKVRTADGNGGRGGRQAIPNLVVCNPTDLQTIRLQRTPDGIYIWGNPSDTPMSRLWGVNVIESLHLTAGTAFVIDTTWSRIRMRQQATVDYTETDSNDFQSFKAKIRARIRAGLEIRSGQATCTVTAL